MSRTLIASPIRALIALATRLAIVCLVASLAATGAMPTVGRVASSESEKPLETDEDSLETALPGSQRQESRRHLRHSDSRPDLRERVKRINIRRQLIGITGHRLANGLSAPLRC